jgi:hypothetical protein
MVYDNVSPLKNKKVNMSQKVRGPIKGTLKKTASEGSNTLMAVSSNN